MEDGWEALPIGKAEVLRRGDDLLLLAYGTMVYPAMQVADMLTEHGVRATVVNARFAKPLDTELIIPLAQQMGQVVTLEEGCIPGGFGSAVVEALMDQQVMVPVTRIGVPDQLVEHATPDQSKIALGLTPAQISERVLAILQQKPAPSFVS